MALQTLDHNPTDHLECGDLSPLCLSEKAFLSIGLGKQRTFHFNSRFSPQNKRMSFPRAKLLEKESGDESPHSKGRLFRDLLCFTRAPRSHYCCPCLRREPSRHGVTGNYGVRAKPALRITPDTSYGQNETLFSTGFCCDPGGNSLLCDRSADIVCAGRSSC